MSYIEQWEMVAERRLTSWRQFRWAKFVGVGYVQGWTVTAKTKYVVSHESFGVWGYIRWRQDV